MDTRSPLRVARNKQRPCGYPLLSDTLAWSVIGFREHALVPVIDFLEPRQKEKCWHTLREYFRSKPRRRESVASGHRSGSKKFDHDPAKVKRFAEIRVNHGGNVDELIVSYDEYRPGGRW